MAESNYWTRYGFPRRTVLRDIQASLFSKAKAFRDGHIRTAESYDQFKQLVEEQLFLP